MNNKIKSRAELKKLLATRRARHKRIVFTNGCFDLLHIGHTRYLQAARELGDVLVVGVNTDASVRAQNKGAGRPLVPEAQRAEVLAALACVDYVVLFDEPEPGRLIAELQPDVLVKGGDWAPDQIIGREVVEARGGAVRTSSPGPGRSPTPPLERIQNLQNAQRLPVFILC